MVRSLENLLELADENKSFLENSLSLFYAGHFFEIKRIAATIRTLIHDTSSSVSLIKQIEAHPDNHCSHPMSFYDAGGFPQSLQIPGSFFYLGCTLPCMPLDITDDEFSKAFRYSKSRNHWWERVILACMNTVKPCWSRKDLVLMYANKEGGSHVDPQLPTDLIAAQNSFLQVGDDYEIGIAYIVVYEAGITMVKSLEKYLIEVRSLGKT